MGRKGRAFAFALALVAGLAGGLAYSWLLTPVSKVNNTPDSLDRQDKLVYVALIGDLYAHDQDLERAKLRLTELGVEPQGSALAALIEQHLDAGGDPQDVRNLALLARGLGASGGILLVFGQVPELPSATPVPALPASPSPALTASPTPFPYTPHTPAPAFALIEQTARCAPAGQPGQIAVWVRDAQGLELAGVEISVTWAAGQDSFYTGLRPERGSGYGDFQMSPHTPYDVSVAGAQSEVARGLSADLQAGVCPTPTLYLDWQLTFQRLP